MTPLLNEAPIDALRSEIMRRVRRNETGAENTVAAALRKLGIRFRRNVRSLPGTPDFANKRQCWIVFVHGCFWHRHRNCARATTPKHNRPFWLEKFAANEKRDRRNSRTLRSMGFHVYTIWECETEDEGKLLRRFERLAETK